jgi:hypothetical protein
MRYLLLIALATVLVCGGCGGVGRNSSTGFAALLWAFLCISCQSRIPGVETNTKSSEITDARTNSLPRPKDPAPTEVLDCSYQTEPTPDECARTFNGWLSPWIGEDVVLAKLGPPEQKGEKSEQAYDGAFHQSWSYRSKGILLEMNGDTEASPMTMRLVTIIAPSELTTPEGIGVGSPESQARSIYEKHSNPDYSDEKRLVLGTVYFGTMIFFEDQKVTEIIAGNIHE